MSDRIKQAPVSFAEQNVPSDGRGPKFRHQNERGPRRTSSESSPN